MKINKIILTLVITISLAFSIEVSQERALDVAENFYFFKNDPRNSSFNYESINQFTVENENIFYVINLSPEGYILISSDDLIMPILAYSFENNFISTNIPVNIDFLFNQYANELNLQKELNSTEASITQQWNRFSEYVEYEGENRSVSPLIEARFDQGSAWNDMCPEDPDGPGGNVLVGCVAVSMAQIMHYWSYPEVGYGSHAYNHWEYGYQQANFGNSFYDYSDMPNNYASTESQELLYHCGVSVNMGYGTDGSGASVFGGNPSTYYAMRNYFLFKNDMSQVFPENYSTVQYRNLLQNELNSNRPIIYVGYSNDGGHAWNIDGYDGDYFHNNWGWGGSQNGYYLLSALNGFNSSQGALINIEPQSLDNPNVVMQNYNYIEQDGDGDLVANPGESINLMVTVENLIPWDNAANTDLILTTDSPYLNIINDYINIDYLASGNSYTNTEDPFVIEISNDINFATHQLQINIISTGNNGAYNENLYYIDINVSMQQAGFPYTLTLLDDNNNEYSVVTTIQSSPTLIDINNDGIPEIFFGDDGGYFHGIDNNGNTLSGFPIELPGDTKDIWGSPASGDIDNDGEIEFIINSKNKHCYIIDEYGNIELDYDADQYLMGTPTIANLDDDEDLEIVFTGYTVSGKVFAINHNGTNVSNFPVNINEKILRGVAIHDINGNGKDDIVVATENEKFIAIIYDNGVINQLLTSNEKFKTAPTIINNNGNILIVAGDEGGHFYGVNPEGNIIFDLITGDKIRSEAGVIEINNETIIFIGSEDGFLYAIDTDGNMLENWPQYIGDLKINSSPVFADLDNDNTPEIISATEEGVLIIFNIDGSPFNNFPIQLNNGFISSPTVADIDNDNDLEIIIGTTQNLSIYDIKETSISEPYYWNTYKGNNHKTGSYISNTESNTGDLNADGDINILDVVVLINIIIGEISPTPPQLISGDVNSDGIINILDVVQLINLIL